MLDDTVTLLLYDYFKQDRIVEQLTSVAARYTRCALMYPDTARDTFLYLTGWVTALARLRQQVELLVGLDDEWLELERTLALQHAAYPINDRPGEVLRMIFETQIDWCLTFFETCVSYADYMAHGHGRPRTRHAFERFTAHAQHAWSQLTTPAQATVPPANRV